MRRLPAPRSSSPRGFVAALVAACLIAPVARGQQDAPTRSGRHAELHVHPAGASAEVVDAAWAAVERSLAQVRAFGQSPGDPVRVDLHLVGASFEAARGRRDFGFEVTEFAVRDMRRAHVLLWPDLSDEVRTVVALPAATRDAIVRQVAWLCASQTDVGRDDPFVCQVFAAGVVDAIDNPKHESGVHARYDGRRRGYHQFVANGGAVTLAEWLDWLGVPESREMWSYGWEMAGRCAQLLADKSRSWPKKLLKKPRGVDSNGVGKIRRAAFGSVLGGNWEKVEKAFQEQLREPLGWIAMLPDVQPTENGFRLAGRTDAEARLCRIGTLPDEPYAVTVTARMHELGDEIWRMYWFHDGRTFAVFFESDRVHVQSWDGEDWTMLDSKRFEQDRYDPIAVRVEVRDNVTVQVDGETLLEVECKGFDMRDEVGVAVNDGVVDFEGLAIEVLKK